MLFSPGTGLLAEAYIVRRRNDWGRCRNACDMQLSRL